MDEIADKAEVLLVGEIVEISAVEKIDADKTRWNTPLLRMAAKIRVLRTFKRNGAPAIQQEQQSSRDRNHIKMSIRETCADADFIFQLLP